MRIDKNIVENGHVEKCINMLRKEKPVYEKFFDSELGVNFWIVLVYAHQELQSYYLMSFKFSRILIKRNRDSACIH